jgi:hypothetical protein
MLLWRTIMSNRTNKARAAREHEPVTLEHLERAVALCAYLVVLDGPVAIPWFERVERELAAMRAQQATVERAKALLESYRPPREDVPRLNHLDAVHI